MSVLGRDFSDVALSRFKGRLYTGTLTTRTPGAYNPAALGSGTNPTTANYPIDGIAFNYEQKYIDGKSVLEGDYRVVMLRDPALEVPTPGDSISIPPPGQTVAQNATIIAVLAVTEAQITVQARGVPL